MLFRSKTEYHSGDPVPPPTSIEMYYGDQYILDDEQMYRVYYKGYNLYSDTDRGDSPTGIVYKSSDPSIATVKPYTVDGKPFQWVIEPTSPTTYGRVVVYFSVDYTIAGQTHTYSGAILVTVLPTGQAAVPMVAAGKNFTVGLRSDGTVWAWGSNEYGQLGDGYSTNDANHSNDRSNVVRVQIPADETVIYVAAGNYHALAVTKAGNVYAWGLNNRGQLGVNDNYNRTVPTIVVGANRSGERLNNITLAAAGDLWSMVMTRDGKVYSWGENGHGQLGDNTGRTKSYPVRIRGHRGGGYMANVISIACGDNHGLVVRTDGSVYSWGANASKQLGLGGTNTADRVAPQKVQAGANDYGPSAPISGGGTLSEAISVAAGANHSLVLTREGNVFAWGANNNGQLGNALMPVAANSSIGVPIMVNTGAQGDTSGRLSNINSIAAKGDHNVALHLDATLNGDQGYQIYAWGSNANGELMNGTATAASTPILTAYSDYNDNWGGTYYDNYEHVAFMAAPGYYHTALVSKDGFVYSGGNNDFHELANGLATNSMYPVRSGTREEQILVYDPDWDGTAATIDSAAETTDLLQFTARGAISADTSLIVDTKKIYRKEYEGFNLSKPVDNRSLLTGTFQVEILDTALVKMTRNGTQLIFTAAQPDRFGSTIVRLNHMENGVVTDSLLLPITVKDAQTKAAPATGGIEGPEKVTAAKVEAGYAHTVLLRPDGTVWAWGRDNSGQLGDNDTTGASKATTMQVLAGEQPVKGYICQTCGKSYTQTPENGVCDAVDTNGIACGGTLVRANNYLSEIVAISVGGFHTLALSKDGYVYAWGSNGYGQLGNGTTGAGAFTPVRVKVGAQATYRCSVCGYAYATGGVGAACLQTTTVDGVITPCDGKLVVADEYLHDIVAVVAGYDTSYALDKDGYVYAWGNDNYIQSGNGKINPTMGGNIKSTPVRVVDGTAAGPKNGTAALNYLSHVVQLSAADGHVAALRANGTVVTWGRRDRGQLGVGTSAVGMANAEYYVNVPKQIHAGEAVLKNTAQKNYGEFLYGAMAVTTGGSYINNTNTPAFTLVLTSDTAAVDNAGLQNIYGFGDNTYGQINSQTTFTIPGARPTDPVTIVAASFDAPVLTLKANASNVILGRANDAINGITYPATIDGVPVQNTLTGLNERIAQIDAGAGHAMLRTVSSDPATYAVDGTNGWRSTPDLDVAYVWGRGNEGQMGDGLLGQIGRAHV